MGQDKKELKITFLKSLREGKGGRSLWLDGSFPFSRKKWKQAGGVVRGWVAKEVKK